MKQQGQELSGTLLFGGELRQDPIEKPELRGDRLTFEVHDGENGVIHFRVALTDSKMIGDASLGDRITQIELRRASPFRVSSGVSAPVPIHKEAPEYSEEARKAKLRGVVVLSIEVDPNGDTQNIKVMRSLGSGLDEKAIECVGRWKFRPGYKGDEPITVSVAVEMNFRL